MFMILNTYLNQTKYIIMHGFYFHRSFFHMLFKVIKAVFITFILISSSKGIAVAQWMSA